MQMFNVTVSVNIVHIFKIRPLMHCLLFNFITSRTYLAFHVTEDLLLPDLSSNGMKATHYNTRGTFSYFLK